jgi:hypothetical protein
MLHDPALSRSGNGRRFIFVGGAARSGTTLVQNILDSHPDIAGGPEFLHLVRILELRNALRETAHCGWTADYASANAVDRQIARLVEDLLLPLADRQRCRMLSEKTPSNTLVFAELMEVFPEARFVHVVRDPRATIASMLRVGGRAREKGLRAQSFTRSVRHAANHIKRSLRAGFRAGKLAPDRLLEVRYEALVSEPAGEIGRICAFLDVPYAPQMLDPAGIAHIGEKPITEGSGNLWYDVGSYRRNPDPSGLDNWRHELNLLQQAIIAVSFAEFEHADRLDYDLAPKAFAAPIHAAARARHLLRDARGMLRRHSSLGVAALLCLS